MGFKVSDITQAIARAENDRGQFSLERVVDLIRHQPPDISKDEEFARTLQLQLNNESYERVNTLKSRIRGFEQGKLSDLRVEPSAPDLPAKEEASASTVRVGLKDGKVEFACMEPTCRAPWEEGEVKAVIQTFDKAEQEKYTRFKRNLAIARNPNCRWCVRPGCDTAMDAGDPDNPNSDPKLTCPTCGTNTCADCAQRWHEGDCQDEENVEWDKWLVGKDLKSCPRCRILVWKNGGCNHMTCMNCQYEFCWLCKRPYDQYHFSDWNAYGCPDAMFDHDSTCFKRVVARIFALFCGMGIFFVPLMVYWFLRDCALTTYYETRRAVYCCANCVRCKRTRRRRRRNR